MPPQISPEAGLARQLLAGDPGAFDRFVETFRSRVFQYSYLMCGQREDAEEVAQETLLKVFEKIDQLREPEHVKPWVFQIAKNACRMMRRKSIFAPREEVSLETSGAEIGDRTSLPDQQVMQRELHSRLSAAIRELPEKYRAVFLLREVEELSTEETAKLLAVSADVVKTRLVRARRMMREKLGANGEGLRPMELPGPLAENVRDDMRRRYRKRISAGG